MSHFLSCFLLSLLFFQSIRKHAALYPSDVNSSPLFIWAAQHGMHSEFDSDPSPPDDILTVSQEKLK